MNCQQIILENNTMEEELLRLRRELELKDKEIADLKSKLQQSKTYPELRLEGADTLPPLPDVDRLDNASIARYSRQLILPEIGPAGQLKLKSTSVLIVGAGGLGCPSAIYLAAAGVGRLGLVDYDEVELSNLHRQILHTEERVGVAKSASIAQSCNLLNGQVECIPYHLALDSTNALPLLQQYDIVVDATDNVATRYLLNDACVLLGKPLVSGSALRFEGQLTVYNYRGGPCYRCLYPKPPPPETVTNCSDGGVLGVVPGIIGCIQALEVIKIATDIGISYSQRLLLFDGLETTFRCIRLRGRQPSCVVCGDNPTINQLIDYEQFCGSVAGDHAIDEEILDQSERISAQDYCGLLRETKPHILVDVRTPVELSICSLPNPSVLNIPVDNVDKDEHMQKLEASVSEKTVVGSQLPIYVVCRRGNDSQRATRVLQDKLRQLPVTVQDIRGGLLSWARHVDPQFPVY